MLYMRHPRVLRDGASYHVTARANRGEFVFSLALVKELFLEVIREAKRKYSFRIETFCIMGNHIHLVIKPRHEESLSVIMQWILGVFAIRYNRLLKLSGHVWGERFHSSILRDRTEFMKAFSYIGMNPVRAGLVEDARDWLYGAIRHFHMNRYDILDAPPKWLADIFRDYQMTMLW